MFGVDVVVVVVGWRAWREDVDCARGVSAGQRGSARGEVALGVPKPGCYSFLYTACVFPYAVLNFKHVSYCHARRYAMLRNNGGGSLSLLA